MSQNIKGVAELELKTDRFNQAAKKSTQELKNLGTKGQSSIKSMNQPITALYNKLSSLGSQGKNASDKIRQGASQAKQAMTGLGTSGKMASDQISQSANTAKQSLSTLGSQGRTSMGNLGNAGMKAGTQVSASMNQAATSVRGLGAATQQTSAQMGVLVLGVAALGTSVGTTYTSLTAIDKAQLKTVKSAQKLEKAHIGVARAQDLLSATQLAVERFTLSIAAMERAGKTDTDAYAIAVKNLALQNDKLTTAYDDLAVKMTDIKVIKESVRIAGVDLEDTYTNMTISIFNTALMSAFLAKTMLPGLSVPTKLVTGLTAGLSLTYKILGPNIAAARMHLNWMRADLHLSKVAFTGASLTAGGFTAALSGVRIGLGVVKTGLHAMWVALGPIGWAVLGIIAIYEVWANNLFDVQGHVKKFNEALHEMWDYLKRMIPEVRELVAIYERVFPPALEESEKATEELVKSQKEEAKTLQALEDSLRKYDRVMADSHSSEISQKIALDAVIENRAKNDEAIGKTAESQLNLDNITAKHNRRLEETVPLLERIRNKEKQLEIQQTALARMQEEGNGQSERAIMLQGRIAQDIEALINLDEKYEQSHIGVIEAQDEVNESISQGTDDMTAYGEVVYDTAGNLVTLDNGLVGANNSMGSLTTTTGTTAGAFSGLNGELGRTGGFIESFNEMLTGVGVTQLEAEVTALKQTLIDAKLEGIDPLSPAFLQAKDAIMPAIESISGRLYDTFGEERMNTFGDSMIDFGIVAVGEMDKIKKSVSDVGDAIEITKKNYNSLMSQTGGLTQATGKGTSTQTRKGLVTQTFFNSLPANLKGNYRPQSGSVGLPTSLRDSIARRLTKSLTPAGLLARVFGGGFLRRTESQKWNQFKLGDEISLFREYKKRGFDTKPIFQLLKESTGNPHRAVNFAKQRIAQDDMEIAEALAQRAREREESVLYLGLKLGHTRSEIRRFSQTKASLQGFKERATQQAGITSQQFQNFIETNSGRADLSNLLAHQQREEFLAALV